MAYIYSVEMDNGKSFNVQTEDHHDHHTRDAFISILREILIRTASISLANRISRFSFKGRK